MLGWVGGEDVFFGKVTGSSEVEEVSGDSLLGKI